MQMTLYYTAHIIVLRINLLDMDLQLICSDDFIILSNKYKSIIFSYRNIVIAQNYIIPFRLLHHISGFILDYRLSWLNYNMKYIHARIFERICHLFVVYCTVTDLTVTL